MTVTLAHMNKVVTARPGCKTISPGTYRVVFLEPRLDVIYLQPIVDTPLEVRNGRSRRRQPAISPVGASLSMFERDIEGPCLIEIPFEVSSHLQQPKESLNKASQDKYEKWSEILKELGSPYCLYEMLVRGRYQERLTKVALANGVHRTTLARKLCRYFVLGGDVHATCMSDLRRKKNANKERKRSDKRLGRKHNLVKTNHISEAESGNNAHSNAIEALRVFAMASRRTEQREGKTRKLSMAARHQAYQTEYASYISEIRGEHTIRIRDPRYNLSERQFTYYWKKQESEIARAKTEAGERTWNKDLRLLISHARADDQFPGSTYVIDSTVGDVYLVSAFDRKILIGRPVIYVVADVNTYTILGVHVCLEGPSVKQARIALYRAVAPKGPWLESLGLSGDADLVNNLPQGCRPVSFLADRGELISREVRPLSQETSIAQKFAAAFRADWKSIVERYFGILNDEIIHWLPGAVHGRNRERGEKDSRLDAKLTLTDLTRILLREAAIWNASHDMSRHMPISLRNHAKPFPASMYNAGLALLHGSPYYYSTQEAVKAFIKPEDASATRKGIEWGKRQYVNNWMVDDEEFYEQRQSKESAKIYPNPDCGDEVYLIRRDGTLRAAQVVDRHDVDNISRLDAVHEDWDDLNARSSYEGQLASRASAELVDGLRQRQNADVEQAEAESAAAQEGDTTSKSAKVGSIMKNRKAEVAGKNKPALPVPSYTAIPPQMTDEDREYLAEMTALREEQV